MRRSSSRGLPLLFLLAGLALAAAVAIAVVLGVDDDLPSVNPAPSHASVRLTGVGAYDPPPGDGREHDEAAPNATDRDAATYWTTESYDDFAATKPGVGLVLDAGKEVSIATVRVRSDTPGFTAEIRIGPNRSGPFRRVSSAQTVSTSTTFDVDGRGRYWLVWITRLEGRAHVNEVTARS